MALNIFPKGLLFSQLFITSHTLVGQDKLVYLLHQFIEEVRQFRRDFLPHPDLIKVYLTICNMMKQSNGIGNNRFFNFTNRLSVLFGAITFVGLFEKDSLCN